MKKFTLCLAMLLTLLATTAFAQKVTYKIVETTAVVGLKNPEVIGDYIFIDKGSEADTRTVSLLKTEAVADIEVETADREVVIPVDLGKGVYLFEKPGTYIVRLEVIDWDKQERRKTIFKLEVKGGVKPIPAGAQWKLTLKEIGPFVAKMSKADRQAVANVLNSVADDIQDSKVIAQSQASKFIRSNRPQSPATDALFAELPAKARRDNAKGLQTMMRYYRELADYICVGEPPKRKLSIMRSSGPREPLSFMSKEFAPNATQPVPTPLQCGPDGCYYPAR